MKISERIKNLRKKEKKEAVKKWPFNTPEKIDILMKNPKLLNLILDETADKLAKEKMPVSIIGPYEAKREAVREIAKVINTPKIEADLKKVLLRKGISEVAATEFTHSLKDALGMEVLVRRAKKEGIKMNPKAAMEMRDLQLKKMKILTQLANDEISEKKAIKEIKGLINKENKIIEKEDENQ